MGTFSLVPSDEEKTTTPEKTTSTLPFSLNVVETELWLYLAGLLIGAILGGIFGFSRVQRIKIATISAFTIILVAAIGEGFSLFGDTQFFKFDSFALLIAVGFGIFALAGVLYNKKRYRATGVYISDDDFSKLKQLENQYGAGFRIDDLRILEAYDKGKNNPKDISIFVNIKEKQVKKRINFLIKKGVLRRNT